MGPHTDDSTHWDIARVHASGNDAHPTTTDFVIKRSPTSTTNDNGAAHDTRRRMANVGYHVQERVFPPAVRG